MKTMYNFQLNGFLLLSKRKRFLKEGTLKMTKSDGVEAIDFIKRMARLYDKLCVIMDNINNSNSTQVCILKKICNWFRNKFFTLLNTSSRQWGIWQ